MPEVFSKRPVSFEQQSHQLLASLLLLHFPTHISLFLIHSQHLSFSHTITLSILYTHTLSLSYSYTNTHSLPEKHSNNMLPETPSFSLSLTHIPSFLLHSLLSSSSFSYLSNTSAPMYIGIQPTPTYTYFIPIAVNL